MRIGTKAALAATILLAPATAGAQGLMSAPPTAPMGAAASLQLPLHEADGQWATPNRHLSAAETVWHLRTALNVAALGCRGAGEAETVAEYNALLASERPALAAASAAVEQGYRARAGAAWQARFDDDMTRLYNFWAQPGAQAAFCDTATAVLRDAATVEPGDFEGFAAAALPRLEAPFIAFFGAVEAYRADLVQWQAGQQAPVQVAAVDVQAGPPGAP